MFFSGIADEAGSLIADQIRAHAKLDWSHIEVRKVNNTTLTLASDEEFDAIYADLQRAGLQVSCIASPIAKRDIMGPLQQDIDELRTAIPRMQRMNTPFIRIMSWSNKSAVSKAEWRAAAISRMKQLAEVAEDGGVTLVHENCDGWGGLGPEQTLELLAEVDSPALKLVFDTGNPVQYEQDSWEYYSKAKKHIVYVHIKDAVPAEGGVKFTFPGDGNGDIERVLTDLFADGYDGGISIEPHLGAGINSNRDASPDEKFNSYIKYGRRLMTLVEKVKPAFPI